MVAVVLVNCDTCMGTSFAILSNARTHRFLKVCCTYVIEISVCVHPHSPIQPYKQIRCTLLFADQATPNFTSALLSPTRTALARWAAQCHFLTRFTGQENHELERRRAKLVTHALLLGAFRAATLYYHRQLERAKLGTEPLGCMVMALALAPAIKSAGRPNGQHEPAALARARPNSLGS